MDALGITALILMALWTCAKIYEASVFRRAYDTELLEIEAELVATEDRRTRDMDERHRHAVRRSLELSVYGPRVIRYR